MFNFLISPARLYKYEIYREIFFPTNLTNLFINARGFFFLDLLGFSLYMTLLTVDNENFIYSFLICFVFLFLVSLSLLRTIL